MRFVSIGGGPAGLWFAILARKALPDARVDVYERNRRDDTFGWGVVFSRETLGNIAASDPESYTRIESEFALWDDIETFYRGEKIVSTGHGFCGLSRKRLLQILQERARGLGVHLHFETEASIDAHLGADLVLGADGVQSAVRKRFETTFRPTIEEGRARFTWLGTTLPLRAFTFVFRESEHGLFQVHAYPFQKDLSTWIVETSEETWRRAGLDRADEAATVAYCSRLFAPDLKGHRLLTNRSIWRAFPTLRCETWRHENVVLLGDAAHTAHFSIGSGTKLAMEDAAALVEALRRWPADLGRALGEYEAVRRPEVERLQRAARTSREWFEDCARWTSQEPPQFAFNLLTRSMRVTWDNLGKRDPGFVAGLRSWYAESVRAPRASDGSVPVPMFTPYEVRGLRLGNRVVVSSMCQYSAVDGTPADWHLAHLGSRAIGGAALVMAEMTDVSAEARITLGCTGMYAPEHVDAWRRIVAFVHGNSGSRIGLQIAHAGRKGSASHPWEGFDEPLRGKDAWETIAPSPIPWAPGWPAPREMDRRDMDVVRDQFVRAARMAVDAGFDWLEVHMAHGYLLSSFLSPAANRRKDAYGGSLANRMRWPLEVLAAVRAAWPEKPISVRISATDWVEGGFTPDESVPLARALVAQGCDVVDVSTSGNSPDARPAYGRMYQVPFADRVRHEAKVPTMTVGGIFGADDVNTILAAGRADLCSLARPHLADPYLTAHAAARYGFPDLLWPGQYALGRPRA